MTLMTLSMFAEKIKDPCYVENILTLVCFSVASICRYQERDYGV